MEIREYTDNERKEVLNKAIAKYGENQLDIAQEELSELIQAISKVKRYPNSKDAQLNLIEEIADVSIMIEQLQIYFGISKQTVLDEMDCKLDRLEDRMFEEDAREFYKSYLDKEEAKAKEFKIQVNLDPRVTENVNDMMAKVAKRMSETVGKIANESTNSIDSTASELAYQLKNRMPKED